MPLVYQVIGAGDEADTSQSFGKGSFVAERILADIRELALAHRPLIKWRELTRVVAPYSKRRNRDGDSDDDGSHKKGNGEHTGYSSDIWTA